MASQQGWSQQTAAIKSMISSAMGGRARTSTGTKRRKTKKAASARGAKRSGGTSLLAGAKKLLKAGKKLKKGSAQAKAYMASIRRKRK